MKMGLVLCQKNIQGVRIGGKATEGVGEMVPLDIDRDNRKTKERSERGRQKKRSKMNEQTSQVRGVEVTHSHFNIGQSSQWGFIKRKCLQ